MKDDSIPDDTTQIHKILLSWSQAGEREALRRFALACARGSVQDVAAPPLWTEALDLLQARVDGTVSEGTFRHRAPRLECRFPMLTIVSGLRNGDPRAAVALTVLASLRTSALESALDAGRGERLVARMGASRPNTSSATCSLVTVVGEQGPDASQAERHCLLRQLARLVKTA